MIELTGDQIGRHGELVAAGDLSRPVMGRYRRPLFRAAQLGEKYPTVDFLVDTLGRGDVSLGFFFVQVKATSEAVEDDPRLPVDLPIDRFNRLVRMPAPTFVIGVDLNLERSYLVSAHKTRKTRVSSITKSYCLRDDRVKDHPFNNFLFWSAGACSRFVPGSLLPAADVRQIREQAPSMKAGASSRTPKSSP